MSKKEVLSELKVNYVSDYVSELVAKGIEKEHIVKSLKKSGYSQKLIDTAFLKVGENRKGFLFGSKISDDFENLKKKAHYLAEKSYEEKIRDEKENRAERERLVKAKFKTQNEAHKKGLLFSGEKVRIHMGEHIYSKHRTPAIVVALFTMGLMITSIFLFGFQYDCDNEQCFVDKANNCERTTYENIVSGVSYSYSIEGCAVVKTLVSLPESEPYAVQSAFEGKSMSCSYERLSFDLRYIQGLNHNLENCYGSLKNVVEEYGKVRG